jgi:hypothetical protein
MNVKKAAKAIGLLWASVQFGGVAAGFCHPILPFWWWPLIFFNLAFIAGALWLAAMAVFRELGQENEREEYMKRMGS